MRDEFLAVDHEVEAALEHVDELILGGMDVRRHEGAGREAGVPGERSLANLLRHIGLAQDVPDDAVDAGIGPGNACGHRLHARDSLSFDRERTPARDVGSVIAKPTPRNANLPAIAQLQRLRNPSFTEASLELRL